MKKQLIEKLNKFNLLFFKSEMPNITYVYKGTFYKVDFAVIIGSENRELIIEQSIKPEIIGEL